MTTIEGHFSDPTMGSKLGSQRAAEIVSELKTIGIISGLCLAIALVGVAIPFSDQVASSLSVLS